MQTLSVNRYDMAYLDVGRATANSPPLVLVHSTLGDFRTWNAVLGPLSKRHLVIALSLRRFFPEHWDRHRQRLSGGAAHRRRHRLYRKAECRAGRPGGAFPRRPYRVSGGAGAARSAAQGRSGRTGRRSRTALQPSSPPPDPVPLGPRVSVAAEMVRNGDIDGALALFVDGIDGEGAWARWPAGPRQQLRDKIYTLLGQVGENRDPFLKREARSINTPTLLIGGGDTRGALAVIWRVLAEHVPGAGTAVIPGTRHWMFEQAPQEFCDVVVEFLTV
jgi:esterase